MTTATIAAIRESLAYARNVGASAVPINPDALESVLDLLDGQAAEIERLRAGFPRASGDRPSPGVNSSRFAGNPPSPMSASGARKLLRK